MTQAERIKMIKSQQSIESKDFLNAKRQEDYTEWVSDSPESAIARGDCIQIKTIFSVKLETYVDVNRYDRKILETKDALYQKVLSDCIREKLTNQNNGNMLLHEAAKYPNSDMIHTLVQLGFDVNAKNHKGETPLMIAARHSNPIVLRTLIEDCNANIRLTDNNKMNLMHAAARYMSVEDIRYIGSRARDLILGKSKWGYTPLFSAAANGCFENTLELIKYKSNINTENDLGNTALYYAVWAGEEKIAETLCIYGADPLHKNKEGFTPMEIAFEEGYVDLVEKMKTALFRRSIEKGIASIKEHINEVDLIMKTMGDSDLRQAFNAREDFYYDLMRANSRIQEVKRYLSGRQKLIEQQKQIKDQAPAKLAPVSTQSIMPIINNKSNIREN